MRSWWRKLQPELYHNALPPIVSLRSAVFLVKHGVRGAEKLVDAVLKQVDPQHVYADRDIGREEESVCYVERFGRMPSFSPLWGYEVLSRPVGIYCLFKPRAG